MADTVTLAEWTGRDVRVGTVLERLDRLRRQGQQSLAIRTSVVTLVVRAPTAVDAWDALATVHRLGGRHPGRSIVVVADPAAAPRLDARVSLTASEAAGRQVWFEDVVLDVRGPAAGHLDSLIEPFSLSDLPLVLWFISGAPVPSDPLLGAADAVVVDSKLAVGEEGDRLAGDGGRGPAPDGDGTRGALPHRETLAAVAGLFGRRPVVDLAWIRLQPWRALLAGLADADPVGPLLRHVTSVEVRGKPGARALLGGWLASRLHLRPGVLELADARHASMVVRADDGDRRAVLRVARRTGERTVEATADVDGSEGPLHLARVHGLPEKDPTWALSRALGDLRRDRVYEHAVRHAERF